MCSFGTLADTTILLIKKPVSHLPDYLPEPERSSDDSGQGSGLMHKLCGANAAEIQDALATW